MRSHTQVTHLYSLYSRHLVQKLHKQPVQSRLCIALRACYKIDKAGKGAFIVHQLEGDFGVLCVREKKGCHDLEDVWVVVLMNGVSRSSEAVMIHRRRKRWMSDLQQAMHNLFPDVLPMDLK